MNIEHNKVRRNVRRDLETEFRIVHQIISIVSI